MKKLLLLFAVLLCFLTISCDEMLPGIGNDTGESENYPECGTPYLTDNITSLDSMPPETASETAEEIYLCVDWMDFVRIGGVVYDGGFENRTVDGSLIGEKIGEVLYKVKSAPTQEEFDEANKADFASYLRPVGSAIYKVKNDENSIAVLDGGEYYLYTHRVHYSIGFEASGGEMYGIPGESRCVTVNTPLELAEVWGCVEPVPQDISERYGDKLQDITLVIVQLVSGWGGTEYGIESVIRSGDDINVGVVQFDSDAGGDEAMHYWTFYIEIPKTDNKNVVVNVTTVKPLENDSELAQISYEIMNNYVQYQTETDHSSYEGTAVIHRFSAEERARSLGDYSGYSADVSYCGTNNYWLVRLTRWTGGGGHSVDTVIRAADGKVISVHEDYLEFAE